jgi:hypothetical protein
MAVRHERGVSADGSGKLDVLGASQELPIFLSGPDSPAAGVGSPSAGRPSARRSTVAWRVGLGVLLVALVAAGAWRLSAGGSDEVVARPAVGGLAPAPAVVPALTISVDAPATVVAGVPAQFVVHYADGEGVFSGTIEDWGDVGVGSGSQAPCTGSTPAPGPLKDSYVAMHTWTDPGTYPVAISVTTYTCRGGQAVEETKRADLTVVVTPR